MPCWARPPWAMARHFPDTDAQFYGASSVVLLAMRCVQQVSELINLDSTSWPKNPNWPRTSEAMCACIAQTLGVDINQINVKAKTAEKLGPVG